MMRTERFGVGVRAWWALAAALIAAAAPSARAQESPLTPAATQPAKGRLTLRTQYFYTRYDAADGRDVGEHRVDTLLTYGLRRDVAVSLRLPMIVRDDLAPSREGGGGDAGFGDLGVEFKWRFWQDRSPGLDTTRLALTAGLELPTGTADLSSHSVDPSLGGIFTLVRGRHGLNQSVRYTFNTGTVRDNLGPGGGSADLLELRTSYLFRLLPARFDANSHGAWYLTIDSELYHERNGDTELLLSPGVLYEGTRWAAELGLRLPAYQRVDERAEVEFGVYAGLRFLF